MINSTKNRSKRILKDRLFRYMVALGGGGAVFFLALIFIYLSIEVAPLFRGASMEPATSTKMEEPIDSKGDLLYLERYGEIGVVFSKNGNIRFFNVGNGTTILTESIALPAGVSITGKAKGDPEKRTVVYGLSNGSVIAVKHDYEITYPNDIRKIEPKLIYPFGQEPIKIDSEGKALLTLSVTLASEGGGQISAYTAGGRLLLARISLTESFMTGEMEAELDVVELPAPLSKPTRILAALDSGRLYSLDRQGKINLYDIRSPDEEQLLGTFGPFFNEEEGTLTAIELLTGAQSMIFGSSKGNVVQWLATRDDQGNASLSRVREFESHQSSVMQIIPEYSRKGFITVDHKGTLKIHHATSSRTLLEETAANPKMLIALSTTNKKMAILDEYRKLQSFDVDNPHPEISFSALWGKVWYEGREKPEYVWQSSTGSDDAEGKYSLIPLAIGTFKAAFFALLFAVPLAILGALYTACFLKAKVRNVIKPTLELMGAMPTVILGFLAGLWLAPLVENNLVTLLGVFLFPPLAAILFSIGQGKLPKKLRSTLRMEEGREIYWMVPVVFLVAWYSIETGPWIETILFDGNLRQWLTDQGIDYDQRNAMIVGIAMGFAVIPTIFSIAEDAIHSVPKHLVQGSLALGATSWQTVSRVVLQAAAPGIFSALMIGLGRAVGETMIVLMAAGNSPVLNLSPFEGMRTFSANLAVELPEAAVGGTHYRLLFLTALLLFILTFILNSAAEKVRQRFRKRYSLL